MKMSLDKAAGLNLISAYADGQVTIRDVGYAPSLLVLPTEIIVDWSVSDITQLDSQAISRIAEHQPEIVILGTGTQQCFPDPRVLIPLMAANIGYEIMNNAAACRTYNILLSENRKAALALLP
jgi:uncharacterized protein